MAPLTVTSPGHHRTAALGTVADILVADPSLVAAATALLEEGLAEVDLLASRFRDDSELARVNASAGRRVDVSPEFAEVLGTALRVAAVTGGLVTPTVGRAIVALGYDRDFSLVGDDDRPLPSPGLVPAWQGVELEPSDGRERSDGVVRLPPGVALDLGATAKAWAADRIARRASRQLGCGVAVSLGGDVSAAGVPPPGGWVIGVADDCRAPLAEADCTVVVLDGGLATSGTTARSWRRGGDDVHHLIDPSTGLPARSPWRTVTLAAATCVDANAAATAAVIAGTHAPAWLAERELPARLVGRDGDVVVVGGWPSEGR